MRADCVASALVLVLLAGAAAGDRRQDLEGLRRAIEDSRVRVDTYEREQRGLLDAIEALDRAAILLRREVGAARRAAEASRLELQRVEAQAGDVERKLAATRRAMEARAVALYRAGEFGSLRLLFSSDGLPNFLSRVATLRRLLDHDLELVQRHRAQVQELEVARGEARASAERLSAAQSRLAERSADLDAERQRRRGLVTRLHADRVRERGALVELEKAARALEETLEGLEAGDAEPLRPTAGAGFAGLRGQLDPPVSAPVSRGFGRVVDREFRTETFHSGYLFDASHGTPVAAVAAGRVRYAGWFRGYGRLVIIDHGGGYFSVAGHLDELAVEAGDDLDAREVIGRVGETGSLSGPRLYFEIRRGSQALDPGDWLRTGPAR